MTIDDLIAKFRQRADDATAPYLYTDEDAIKWAAEAEEEACIRAKLLRDDETDDICTITMSAGTDRYALDGRIEEIEAVYLASNNKLLTPTDPSKLDRLDCRWKSRTGTPSSWFRNRNKLQVWPTPTAIDALNLRVIRTPLYPMETLGDEPEIPEKEHDGLVHWMLYRAFGGKDGEENDDKRSANAYNQFVAQFGMRHDANARRAQQSRRSKVVRAIKF